MVNVRATAAILLAVVAIAAAHEGGHHQLREWIRQCRQEFPVGVANRSEPMVAMKKTVTGLYDPHSHRAYRKSVVTFAKFESAIIRDPKEAEMCMINCLAEKLRWINGKTQQINSSAVIEGVTRFAEKINSMAKHRKIDMSKLKKNVMKCIVGTAGVYKKDCEKGYELLRCVHTSIIESMYVVPTTTSPRYPTTTAASWPETTEQPPAPEPERFQSNSPVNSRPLYAHRPVHRFGRPSPGMMPPPPPSGMMPPPPPMGYARSMPMQVMPMAQPLPEPAMIAFGQKSGVVEVFNRGPRYGQPWRQNPTFKK